MVLNVGALVDWHILRTVDLPTLVPPLSILFRPERVPHRVRYHGHGEPKHDSPERFTGWRGERGITHCDWIVPGTL